jgi:hypothetical protein
MDVATVKDVQHSTVQILRRALMFPYSKYPTPVASNLCIFSHEALSICCLMRRLRMDP